MNAPSLVTGATPHTASMAPRRCWHPGSLDGVHGVSEAVASRNGNNLYLTSCYFQDLDRYRAFCAMYAVMRVVDDRVDELVARSKVTNGDLRREVLTVAAWGRAVRNALAGNPIRPLDVTQCRDPRAEALITSLAETAAQFPVPRRRWDRFFAAMQYDLGQYGFPTYHRFLEYTEGASVAPTTIYLYLIAADPDRAGVYHPPRDFDLAGCGQALGRFAYLTHLLRDLREDMLTGDRGLLYIATDDLRKHGLSRAALRAAAESGSSDRSVRDLVRTLAYRAQPLVAVGRQYLSSLEGRIGADRLFVADLIVAIYEAALRKILASGCEVMGKEHRLTARDKRKVVACVAAARAARGRGVPSVANPFPAESGVR